MNTILTQTRRPVACPPWCVDTAKHDDSGEWTHFGRFVEVTLPGPSHTDRRARTWTGFLSQGSTQRQPRVFLQTCAGDGIDLGVVDVKRLSDMLDDLLAEARLAKLARH